MESPTSVTADLVQYLPLVHAAAWRLHRLHGVPRFLHEDLVQQGFVGLLDACSRYTPDRGVSFSTYAHHRVTGEMFTWLRRECRCRHVDSDFECHQSEQPVEDAAAAREELAMLAAAVEQLPFVRRRILEAALTQEPIEQAASGLVDIRNARRWKRDTLRRFAAAMAA